MRYHPSNGRGGSKELDDGLCDEFLSLKGVPERRQVLNDNGLSLIETLMDDKRKAKVRALVGQAVDTALLPIHLAVSKPAQRAYLGTALFAFTSLSLFCLSTIAYVLFYYNYIPQVGLEKVIHLQFGDGNPHGTTSLSSALTSQQSYEVTLFLNLPRTPSNLAAGNFMIDLSFHAPATRAATGAIPAPFGTLNTSSQIVARSRRPAILTYTSSVVDTASTLAGLPWYVLGWKRESEALEIVMFEGVEFARGTANVPDSLTIAIEADEKMQFYEAGIRIVARFGGLRWILYHHRVLSFLIFTTTFWSSSMLSMLLVWFALSIYQSSTSAPPYSKTESELNGNAVKSEPSESEALDPTSLEDLSDTSRTFPTLGRQLPLHFAGRKKAGEEAKIKKEEDEDIVPMTNPSLGINEADDEEEEDDDDDEDGRHASEWRDSGIGTSREVERREEVRRRRKMLFGGEPS